MRYLLPRLACLLLTAVFVAPAQAQPPDKAFPGSTLEAKTAVRTSLKAINRTALDALEDRAVLQQLANDLAKSYSGVPRLEDIKTLLFPLINPWSVNPQLDVADPDRAPLLLDLSARPAGFSRQVLRGTNPDLQRVQKETWPPTLTHGEKVAIQAYSANHVFPVLNKDLRDKGVPSPMMALIHDRLQSAFRKAQPFDPPVIVSRGLRIDNKPALDGFLKGLQDAQKDKTVYVMPGYVSCTVGPKVLPGFDGNINIHIKAVHGIDVLPISLYPEEREFLINHNSRYHVTEVKTEAGRWKIYLDQLPPADAVKAGARLSFPDGSLGCKVAA
jgi:hypothetical protein